MDPETLEELEEDDINNEPTPPEDEGGDEDIDDADDSEDEGGDEDIDDADDSEDDNEGDSELGKRAQKRIKKLVGQRKDAEKRVKELETELENARKSGGEDAQTYIAAAEQSGILPEMMTKDLAEAIQRKSQNKQLIAHYEDWLDDGENDEYQLGDKTLGRKDIRRRVRELKDENDDLQRRYGSKEATLRKNVKEIFELGKQALKAGWKPGKKKTETSSKKLDKPKESKVAPKLGGSGKVNWGDSSGAESLADMIQQSEKRK